MNIQIPSPDELSSLGVTMQGIGLILAVLLIVVPLLGAARRRRGR